MNAVSLSVTNLYFYCYAGASVTINCLQYSDIIFETDWHVMPIYLQKYLILMVQSANFPRVLSGYGFLDLNLESFTRVSMSFQNIC